MFSHFQKIQNYFYKGHERSIRAKKNIAASFILKPINILIQLLLVPLMLDYLEPVKYGIWLTVWSVINWFYLFDVGLGNGLRNKLAEAFAKNDNYLAKIYVSTSYAVLLLAAGLLYLIFYFANKFISWQKIFNAPAYLADEINTLLFYVVTLFAVNFVVRLIGSILNADQKSAINDLIITAGNLLSLIFIYIISQVSKGSLVWVGIIIGSSTLLPGLIATVIFLNKKYKRIKPSVRLIKFGNINELIFLGLKFFVMQVSAVIVFTTDNFIIAQLLGPEKVTPYNIALKYFSIALVGFGVIILPFWSAFTEAYVKKDMEWIKRKINQLIKIWGLLVVAVIVMIFVSGYVYQIWIGKSIAIPFSLSILMGVFVIIGSWNNIFAFFLNGIGKIKLQMYYGIIAMVINIPLSIFLAQNMQMGINGIILGTCFSLLFGFVLAPIQVYKIINGTGKGIWLK